MFHVSGTPPLTNDKLQYKETMKLAKLYLVVAIGAAMLTTSAVAGPGPQQVFQPVTKQELGVLKPGTQVAHQCPHCGTIAVSKVGKDMAHAESHTCPVCKMTVTYRDSGSGKAPKVGLIDCVDAKTGKKMTARVCALHK
jgi:predicted RNA-binding Zn-ribbon protein involved in translation (DUF1610 family)